MDTIILASESPRRKELFELMGLPFTCMSPDIDESILPGSDPRNVVKEFAIRKVEKILDELPDNNYGFAARIHSYSWTEPSMEKPAAKTAREKY